MAKKQKCPEFENHERWLVAFADMMTLLFALFVVLYSIANVEMSKLKKVSSSIQKAFSMDADSDSGKEIKEPPRGNSINEGIFSRIKGNTNREALMTRNRREMAAIIAADVKKIERDIEERLYGSANFPSGKAKSKLDPADRVVFVNRDADGIRITLLARKFFRPNEARLTDEARGALDGIAASVKGLGRLVRIEGHTDSLPFNMNGMTNWELSATRASAVVRHFLDRHKFPPQMIYAAGYGDTRPVATNDTPENRALNRRVDVKILYETPSESLNSEAPPAQDAAEGSDLPSAPSEAPKAD